MREVPKRDQLKKKNPQVKQKKTLRCPYGLRSAWVSKPSLVPLFPSYCYTSVLCCPFFVEHSPCPLSLAPLLPQLMLASFPQISSPHKAASMAQAVSGLQKRQLFPIISSKKVTARGPDLVTCTSLDKSFLSFGHSSAWKVGCDKCQPPSDPYGQDWV